MGDVIGKYHPHGDSAVYEAAVRMAQDFTLRYPLIQGQGNFGSRDGDGAAAMRYTEVRLTAFAEEILLSELERGTVDFIPTYDGSLEEPRLLPARLPIALLNGASGIAVGMATEIPPHNMGEVVEACAVALQQREGDGRRDPRARSPGPTFPAAARSSRRARRSRRAYETGRGSVRVRARWTVEKLARGQYRVAVTEMPPGTNAARVLAEIEEITNPKPRAGKKTVSAEALALKSAVLGVLESARDDSDREHPVRLVFEPRTLARRARRAHEPAPRAHLARIERADEPGGHRPRRASAAGGARAVDPRVGRLPAGGARAAPAAPPGRGRSTACTSWTAA